MKKIFFLILIIALIIVIYNNYYKKSNLTLSFGVNNNSDIYYEYKDTRITDITNSINNNEIISEYYLQNALIKSSKIYININGLIKTDSYSSAIAYLSDLEELFALIRKYSKEQIYIQLLEEKSDIAIYINKKIQLIISNYDIIIMR